MTQGTLPAHCPNCEAPVHGPWCAQCGQETIIGTPTIRELSHEYIQNFVSLEGRLWRTLVMLVTRPGGLTIEFLQGRRKRYARPLPLYLSMSFVLFLVLSFFPPTVIDMDLTDGSVQITGDQTTENLKSHSSLVNIKSDPSKVNLQEAKDTYDRARLEAPELLKPLIDRYWQSYLHWQTDRKKAIDKASAVFLAQLPYAVFLMVPVFAAINQLLLFRRKRTYAEHLLFALHFHAFAFLSLLAAYFFTTKATVGWLFLLWMVYLALALRKVFGGRWVWHMLRAVVLAMIYSVVVAVTMMVVLAAAVGTV